MADRTAAQLESIALATVFQHKVAPQINRACPGFQLIPKIPLEPGQSAVTWDITSGTAGSASSGTPGQAAYAPIADGATATNSGVDTLGKATLPIRPYRAKRLQADSQAPTRIVRHAPRVLWVRRQRRQRYANLFRVNSCLRLCHCVQCGPPAWGRVNRFRRSRNERVTRDVSALVSVARLTLPKRCPRIELQRRKFSSSSRTLRAWS